MARNPPDPSLVQLVVDAAQHGTSKAEIARLSGVSESTIREWLKRYGSGVGLRTQAPSGLSDALPAVLPEASDRAEEGTDTSSEAEVDSLAEARRLLRRNYGLAKKAEAVGNYSAAQRAQRDAANMLPVIARLEKAAAEVTDGVRITRADIEAAREKVRARIAALTQAPLACAHCGHALRVQWARGGGK